MALNCQLESILLETSHSAADMTHLKDSPIIAAHLGLHPCRIRDLLKTHPDKAPKWDCANPPLGWTHHPAGVPPKWGHSGLFPALVLKQVGWSVGRWNHIPLSSVWIFLGQHQGNSKRISCNLCVWSDMPDQIWLSAAVRQVLRKAPACQWFNTLSAVSFWALSRSHLVSCVCETYSGFNNDSCSYIFLL